MAEQVKAASWRTANPHVLVIGAKGTPYPATKFFDQLSFIGDSKYGCYVLETSDGMVMLDCLTMDPAHIDTIEKGFADLGLDIHQLKAILVTHGHGDHYGHADHFRERYGAKIYMSQVDYEYARAADDPYSWFPDGPLGFEVDGYLEDGQDFTLGDTSIKIVATPGHTMGCLSFLIPVTDEGRPHLIALWGGTGVPGRPERQEVYLASCDKFARITQELGVDGEITNHPFVDQTLQRLDVVRSIVDGVPNPFVLGCENYKYYELMFRNSCLKKMAETKKKLQAEAAEQTK